MMKSLVTSLSMSDDTESKESATELFKKMLSLYFEGDNSIMNFDFIEIYARHLGLMGEWEDLINLKLTMIK